MHILRSATPLICLVFLLAGCGGGSGGSGSGTGKSGGASSTATAGGSGSSSDSSGAISSGVGGNENSGNPGAPAGVVVTLQAQNYADQAVTDAPITFGQVFAQGDVPAGYTLRERIGSKAIPAQVDKKATWPDGSLRHAVITVRLADLPAGAAPTIALEAIKDSDASQAPRISLNELLGTDFDATATLTISGTTYRASARDALEKIAQSGDCPAWGETACKRWLSGALASEWIVPATLSAGNASTPHLRVYFNIRAYGDGSGGIGNVRVDTVIENDLAYAASPENGEYDAEIAVGRADYAISGLTHYRQARWHKVLWWHGDPEVYAKLDMDYFQSTGAVSRYADLKPTSKFLDSVSQSFPPMSHGNQTKAMGNTGAQAAIGPLPRWTSTYVVSGDRHAFGWMLANDSAVGSYSFHYRDSATGRPLKITDHPYVTLAAISYARSASQYHNSKYKPDLLPKCSNDCGSPYSFDISHHPSIGYVAYLVTGDYYYLEEMQFTASYDELWANPAYRNYTEGKLTGAQGQVRGQAWALRSMSDAAFATPDADPMKSYFVTLVNNILSDYTKTYLDEAQRHPLHVLDDYGAVIYKMNGASRVGIAPWQQDFFTWALGHVAEQGFDGAGALLKWFSQFQVGMMTNWTADPSQGFCWIHASDYSLQVRDARHSPEYQSIDQAYKASDKNSYGLTCNSQAMANVVSKPSHAFKVGEMVGYAFSPTGFPANFQIALAMAADSGIAKNRQAWSIYSQRTVKPEYRNYPNFAVVPRN